MRRYPCNRLWGSGVLYQGPGYAWYLRRLVRGTGEAVPFPRLPTQVHHQHIESGGRTHENHVGSDCGRGDAGRRSGGAGGRRVLSRLPWAASGNRRDTANRIGTPQLAGAPAHTCHAPLCRPGWRGRGLRGLRGGCLGAVDAEPAVDHPGPCCGPGPRRKGPDRPTLRAQNGLERDADGAIPHPGLGGQHRGPRPVLPGQARPLSETAPGRLARRGVVPPSGPGGGDRLASHAGPPRRPGADVAAGPGQRAVRHV